MGHRLIGRRIMAVMAAVAALSAPGPAAHGAGAQAASAPRPAGCDALGNYPVGPRVAAHAQVSPRAAIQPPPSAWRLAGNVILTAYTGCGQPTAGIFSIEGELMGTTVQSGGVNVTVPCASSCLGPPLAVITATGTFKQDVAHAHDPQYVMVGATLSSARPRVPPQGNCPVSCPLGARSRLTFTHVTGYVQVVPGQNVTLAFLPPPRVSLGPWPMALVIYGWRGM